MRSGILAIVAIFLSAIFLYFFDYISYKSKNLKFDNEEIKTVNVYSSRKEELLRDIFDQFTEKTGIKVNVIYDESGKLISKMENEQNNPIADLLITTDIINLEYVKKLDLIEHIDDENIFSNIDKGLYDDDHKWVGLTKRARVIVYSTYKVNINELNDYYDLSDDKWNDKILITSSKSHYNQSLVAGMLVNNSKDTVESWMYNFVQNFARKPQGGETEQIIAVANGIGDITIVNSYYYGRLIKIDKNILDKTNIFFPNQNSSGTHINISGAALVKKAKNSKNALSLINFMLTPEIQTLYAVNNCEFPVINQDVEIPDFLKEWSGKKMDHDALRNLFSKRKDVSELIEKFEWQ